MHPSAAQSSLSPVESPPSTTRYLLLSAAVGSAVAVGLGVYGRLHEPGGVAINVAGFSNLGSVKSWLTTIAAVFAVVQVLSALVMYGRIRMIRAGSGVAFLHRWSGRAAVLVTLPVAAHCLYAVGFQSFDTRVLVHSLLGCFFYGIFVVKMMTLARDGIPGWVLPVTGGFVFTALVGLWLTSALWFFTTFGVAR
jgi:Family of unknown function (DUF6529)